MGCALLGVLGAVAGQWVDSAAPWFCPAPLLEFSYELGALYATAVDISGAAVSHNGRVESLLTG
ncbi:hypothetical protein BBBOND_0308280 [Babesia bigemina]|uniref:Uncharacterized protein n=1 Tax=Babesia bigemina TaxID=5866 RepID=A0A061DCW0_BABBI|nr:hypothetical protein BBBOND_0308280 [Babesia bigemina]CDR96924.1 hypothetical protein BBBOND_0308280 [Babesia bigemina]|eukprot:XP_012769110.1 hypothetical protein BBBOND_0308280 [Babesia bigemina]